jgi:hypothetical protein
MYNNRDATNMGGGNLSITPGMDVFDVNGDKIGPVEQYNPQANCIVVKKGMIFTKDIYVPTSDIQRTSTDGIYLDLSKDDLKDDIYSSPPASTTGGYGQNLGTTRDSDLNP